MFENWFQLFLSMRIISCTFFSILKCNVRIVYHKQFYIHSIFGNRQTLWNTKSIHPPRNGSLEFAKFYYIKNQGLLQPAPRASDPAAKRHDCQEGIWEFCVQTFFINKPGVFLVGPTLIFDTTSLSPIWPRKPKILQPNLSLKFEPSPNSPGIKTGIRKSELVQKYAYY